MTSSFIAMHAHAPNASLIHLTFPSQFAVRSPQFPLVTPVRSDKFPCECSNQHHELSFKFPHALQVHHLCSIYAPHLEHPQPTDSLCLDLDATDEDDTSLRRELVKGNPLLP